MGPAEPQLPGSSADLEMRRTNEAVQEAIAAAESAANPGRAARSTAPGATATGRRPR